MFYSDTEKKDAKDNLYKAVRRASGISNSEIQQIVDEAISEIPGRDDCRNHLCTQMGGRCIGWHCGYCDQPCGPQGHDCPARDAADDEPTEIVSNNA